MRKFSLFSLALLSLAAMNSCTEKLDEAPAAPSQDSFRTINVRASLESGEQSTKTLWKDGAGLRWSEFDGSLFGLIDNKGTNKVVESFSINSDGTASFKGTVAADAAHFFAYYPKVEAAGGGDGDLTINFPIAALQTQQIAGTVDLSSNMLALVGKAPVELGESTDYSAAMELQSSLARFIIYSAKGCSDKVKSVTLSASGNVMINGLWVVVKIWAGGGRSFFGGVQTSKTTVNLENEYDLSGVTSQETASGIYMGLCPANLAGGYVCEVVTDKGKYTFETSSSKEFKAGTIHNIALNLDKGKFESTANDLLFFPGGNEYATRSIDNKGSAFELGATTATYGGEPITMTPEDCVLISENPDGSDASSWATANWVNTNDYNLRVVVAKNKTAAARDCKVYMEYKGIRSKNYVAVHQDPGTGLPVIVPSLTLKHEAEIAYGGETVSEAAELKLTVDGVEVSGSDVDGYLADSKYGVTLNCAGATATCNAGVISIVFPENSAATAKNFKLAVKTEDGSAECAFTQAANPGGETPSHTFEYTLFTNAGDGARVGFDPTPYEGDWYRFENIKIDGKAYASSDELKQLVDNEIFKELFANALVFDELGEKDVQNPGVDPLTSVEEMKQFVTLEAWIGGTAIYVRIKLTRNDTGKRRTFKILSKAGDGSLLATVLYFQNV